MPFQVKKSYFFWGEGIALFSNHSPGGKEYLLPTLHPYQAFWIHPASPRIPARFRHWLWML